jgi:hypothetical protein
MKYKIHLKIILYLFLQFCFFSIATTVFYIIKNISDYGRTTVFASFFISVTLITVIAIIKIKIVKSLLQIKFNLTLVFDLSVSLRLLSIGSSLVYDVSIIPTSSLLTRLFNVTCVISFIVYMVLVFLTYTFPYDLKPKRYLLLTILYKVIEPFILFCVALILSPIFNFNVSIINNNLDIENLRLSILSVLSLLIFLYIYFALKTSLNNKRKEAEYSTLEAIILFIGTMPIIQLIPFVAGIVFILH